MTTLREAAQQAKQVPLRELLASVPADARLVIDDADGKGTRFIPVGRLCREAAAALAEPTCCCGEPTAAGVMHRRDGPCHMAEPVQEPTVPSDCADSHQPVAWRWPANEIPGSEWRYSLTKTRECAEPLYTASPQRKPLTDYEIADVYLEWDAAPGRSMADFARAIERAHGIGASDASA